jgi:hypothetical protein
MKLRFLIALWPVLVMGCQSTAVVGPKPQTAPVSASNAATRQGIQQTRTKIQQTRAAIKDAQLHEAKGATALEKADDLLTQMINQPPSK